MSSDKLTIHLDPPRRRAREVGRCQAPLHQAAPDQGIEVPSASPCPQDLQQEGLQRQTSLDFRLKWCRAVMGFGFLWSIVESEWTGLDNDGNNGRNGKVRRGSPVFRGVRHVISICSKTVTSKRNGLKSTKRMKQARSTGAIAPLHMKCGTMLACRMVGHLGLLCH